MSESGVHEDFDEWWKSNYQHLVPKQDYTPLAKNVIGMMRAIARQAWLEASKKYEEKRSEAA